MSEEIEKEVEETEPEEKYFYDDDIADIIFSLNSVYNNLSEIDTAIMDKTERRELEAWKEKLWRAMGFYIGQLTSE